MPLMVGTIFRWLGVGTPLAEFALSCLSLAFIYVSFLAPTQRSKGWAHRQWRGSAPLSCSPGSTEHFTGKENFSALGRRDAAAGIALYLARALALDARDRRPTWLELGPLAAGGVMTLFSDAAALASFGILVAAIVERRKAFE
jgi:hypothetical protein